MIINSIQQIEMIKHIKSEKKEEDDEKYHEETEKNSLLETKIQQLIIEKDVAYEYFGDIMLFFKKKEKKLFSSIEKNYIKTIQKNCIKWAERNWLVDQFFYYNKHFKNETIFLAITYTDYFLSKIKIFNLKNLQLLAITCLMVASKIIEVKNLSLHVWVKEISNNVFKRSDFIIMEKNIINVLEFDMYQITAYDYINCWLQILNISLIEKFKYCVDFILATFSINGKKYICVYISKLVTLAIYLASIYLEHEINLKLLSEISGYNENDLFHDEDMDVLHTTILNIINENEKIKEEEAEKSLFCVYKTYSEKNKYNIVQLPFKKRYNTYNIKYKQIDKK